jgi:hypothetical protein
MIYDRRFGLPQSIADYLNQPLPDISGVYSLPQAQMQPILFEEDKQLESLATTGLTPEQLALLYPQPQMGGGEGGYQDEDTTIGDGSTLGIDSFGDVIDFGKKNIGTIAAASFFGPVETLIGKGISSFFGSPTLSEFKKAKTFQEFFENQKAQKAATAAKARASAIAQEQANRDAARGAAAAAAQAAANRDRARGRQTGGGDGPSGTSGPGANSSGVGGGADAATW